MTSSAASGDDVVRDRATTVAAGTALALGVGSAAVSAYWAAGGKGLLDTVGGSIEERGRQGGAGVVVALSLIAVLKLVVAAAAPILAGWGDPPPWMLGRVPRVLGWIAAVVLVIYGGALTAVGMLVETGIVDAAADADRHALAWHAWFWDPWFLFWGAAFVIVLSRTRSRAGGPSGS